MVHYDERSVEIQRLYEKWVVKDAWLLHEEAVPLLMGLSPDARLDDDRSEALYHRALGAIERGELQTADTEQHEKEGHRVRPADVYRWARASNIELPQEMVNLMDYILRTVLPPLTAEGDDRNGGQAEPADTVRVLGGCLAVLARYPEECKNSRGAVTAERILKLLEMYSDRIFRNPWPDLSDSATRETVAHWVGRLGHPADEGKD